MPTTPKHREGGAGGEMITGAAARLTSRQAAIHSHHSSDGVSRVTVLLPALLTHLLHVTDRRRRREDAPNVRHAPNSVQGRRSLTHTLAPGTMAPSYTSAPSPILPKVDAQENLTVLMENHGDFLWM